MTEQPQVIDFVIWTLFQGSFGGVRPQHILCHGLQRASALGDSGESGDRKSILPGVVRHHPNNNLDILTSSPWSDLLPLLGEDAELIFSGLLLDCGVFTKLPSGSGNFFQLSGLPVSELKTTGISKTQPASLSRRPSTQNFQPPDVRFVRNRMLYARPSLNPVGKVKFGLHHAHVLQRFHNVGDRNQTIHFLKYIFPRQYGLHNVFTSAVDPAETSQPFKDYTVREVEISGRAKGAPASVPRRVRGAISIAEKIRRNHDTCSYSQLLRHHCATTSPPLSFQEQLVSSSELLGTHISSSAPPREKSHVERDNGVEGTSFLPHSTPATGVSSFCRSVITQLLPHDALGQGLEGQQNLQRLLTRIDSFVRMRRFESMTLHGATQGLRLRSINWLCPPSQISKKMSKSDHSKRLELLHEFVYYIFDSLLIPLIRANFYVTESSTHRNRLFYFRHDIWRKLSEPSLAVLGLNMFVALRPSQARQKLQSRMLGYSHLRLLPKDQGSRPITNLRRRQLKIIYGRRILVSSVNSQLGSLFSVLNYERGRDAAPLGSAMLSVGDLHGRLAAFKQKLAPECRLFFAKVDIKSCFDSIPQGHLLDMVRQLFSATSYRTTRHTEIKSADNKGLLKRRYLGDSRPTDESAVFSELCANELASRKRKVVFADTGNQKLSTRDALLKLLREHVGDSIVKIGKKHMRQTDGIPQGSVLSSLLCSYFYGSFEQNQLAFLDPASCMLLRLIDDFLLVTTDEGLAGRFLETMASGDKRYGISVNAGKSLANFDVSIQGQKVPRLHGGSFFPYCGMAIEMHTLGVRKDRGRKDAYISNTLTVETCSKPGSTLRRKVLASLKLQMHAMLLDPSLNSRNQIVSTLLGNFAESAMKMHQYMTRLGQIWFPSQTLIQSLIEELVTAGTKICWVKSDGRRHVSRGQMCWIAAAAFERVLVRKQTQYPNVLVWLRCLRESAEPRMKMDGSTLRELLRENERTFEGYRY